MTVGMKLLIAGSRSIKNFDLKKYVSGDIDTILSGGAQGIDTIAENFADENKLSKIILRPKYKIYGKYAPLKRNEELVNLADHILIVWDGKSAGTLYTINYARRLNKPLRIITL